MSNGLEAAAGNRMKSILEKLTSNRIKGVLVGAVITAVIQSSSATTVMLVGFVNSGLMTLSQAVWVIMGANIGTTITGQLIALDISAIAPIFAIGGVAAMMFIKNEKVHHISGIFSGLGILFMGMAMMGDAMVPLQDSQTFINFMTTVENPLVGILIGAILRRSFSHHLHLSESCRRLRQLEWCRSPAQYTFCLDRTSVPVLLQF